MSYDTYVSGGSESGQEGQFLQSLVSSLSLAESKLAGVNKYASQLWANFSGDYETLVPKAYNSATDVGAVFTSFFNSSPPQGQLETIIAGTVAPKPTFMPFPQTDVNVGYGFTTNTSSINPAVPDPTSAPIRAVIFNSEFDYQYYQFDSYPEQVQFPEPLPIVKIPSVFYKSSLQQFPINIYMHRGLSGVKCGMRLYDALGNLITVLILNKNQDSPSFPQLSAGYPYTINYGRASDGTYEISPREENEITDAEAVKLNTSGKVQPFSGRFGSLERTPTDYTVNAQRLLLGGSTSVGIDFVVTQNNLSLPKPQVEFNGLGVGSGGTPNPNIFPVCTTDFYQFGYYGGGNNLRYNRGMICSEFTQISDNSWYGTFSTSYIDAMIKFQGRANIPNARVSRCFFALAYNSSWPSPPNSQGNLTAITPWYGIDAPIGSYYDLRNVPPILYAWVANGFVYPPPPYGTAGNINRSVPISYPAEYDLAKVRLAINAGVTPPPAGFPATPVGVPTFTALDINTMPLIGTNILPNSVPLG